MDKNIINLDDTEIEEKKFHQHKSLISINYADVNKIVVSNSLPFGEKDFEYFIGYKDAKKNRPFHIFCLKNGYIYKRNFYKTRCMYFLIKDENFFKKYN